MPGPSLTSSFTLAPGAQPWSVTASNTAVYVAIRNENLIGCFQVTNAGATLIGYVGSGGTSPSVVLYVPKLTGGSDSVYCINRDSGTLVTFTPGPSGLTQLGVALAVGEATNLLASPDGKLIFLMTGESGEVGHITAYSRSSTGALTEVAKIAQKAKVAGGMSNQAYGGVIDSEALYIICTQQDEAGEPIPSEGGITSGGVAIWKYAYASNGTMTPAATCEPWEENGPSALARSGTMMYLCSNGAVEVYPLPSGPQAQHFYNSTQESSTASVSPRGQLYVSGHASTTIWTVADASGKLAETGETLKPSDTLAITPDGSAVFLLLTSTGAFLYSYIIVPIAEAPKWGSTRATFGTGTGGKLTLVKNGASITTVTTRGALTLTSTAAQITPLQTGGALEEQQTRVAFAPYVTGGTLEEYI